MELVVEPDRNGSSETKLDALEFSDQNTLRVVMTHGQDTSIAQIGSDEGFIHFGARILAHTAVSVAGDMLVCLGPLQAEIFDIQRERRINSVKVEGIDGWPLACDAGGLCAWQSGTSIHVQRLREPSRTMSLPVGQDAVLSFAIGPPRLPARVATLLAAAVNDARVRIWRLTDEGEKELPPLALEATADVSLLGSPLSLQGTVRRSLVVPRAGMATVVRFSRDGSLVAAANETGVHVFDVAAQARVALLQGYRGRVSAMAFDRDAKSIAVASEDRVVRLFTLGQNSRVVEVCHLPAVPAFLALRADGRFAAVGFANGSIELWNTEAKTMGARVRVLDDGWIATTPSGLFDASEQGWHRASWQFGGASGVRLPIEAFYKHFYRPGLLSDVLSETPVPLAMDVESFAPALPKVTMTMLERKPPQMELVPGQGIRNTPERMRFRIEARPGKAKGIVRDMHVTLNGLVVKKWPGRQTVNAAGAAVEEIELEIPPGDLRVTAYAFNENDLRSREGVFERRMQGWGYQVEQRTLYVLAIGIGTYQNPKFSLGFADSDARLIGKTLGMSQNELRRVREKVTEWSTQRAIDTPQPTHQQEVPARVQVRTLTNEQATREGVLHAMRDIAKTAQSKDAVVIFYAGHGLSDQDHYYMLPWDMGLAGAPGEVRAEALRKARPTLISDDDIADALSDLKVKYGALILDSCSSGQALEGSELVGPMNTHGLTGWAYERGISLLAGSEASEPGFELKRLGMGVLTAALVREGLEEGKADFRPLDGRIELEEWLRYAAARVPSLVADAEHSGDASQAPPIQQARFAPSNRTRTAFLVLAASDREP